MEKLNEKQRKDLGILIRKGKEMLDGPKVYIPFTNNKETDDLLNNVEEYPHLFVLGCIMDMQIKADRAWKIPYFIMKQLGGFEFERLTNLSIKQLNKIFSENNLHRFNNIMAKRFYSAIQRIKNDYGDDTSKIWKENPSAASVIRKFLEFEGVGMKIASMATNILVRQFKIKLRDLSAIDISTDTHVMRVMEDMGFVPKNASKQYIMIRAREFYPDYPGILDIGLFEIGKNKE